MAQIGEPVGTATPAETLAQLREHSDLSVASHFPAQGVTFYICYDKDSDTFLDRVVASGEDPNDPENVMVDEWDLTEEEVTFRIGVLQEREEQFKNDPIAAIMAQIMRQAGGVPED